jgi:DNA-binding NarL/FixJ family response regulator
LKAGAAGYLSKDRSGDELVGAIRRIHEGGLYVSDAVAEQLAARASGRPPEARHELLSTREHQVLVRLASGQSARTIATEMGLSPKTVHTYRSRIRAKLELDTDAALIRYAVEHHLVE